jgi:hypothetical protein
MPYDPSLVQPNPTPILDLPPPPPQLSEFQQGLQTLAGLAVPAVSASRSPGFADAGTAAMAGLGAGAEALQQENDRVFKQAAARQKLQYDEQQAQHLALETRKLAIENRRIDLATQHADQYLAAHPDMPEEEKMLLLQSPGEWAKSKKEAVKVSSLAKTAVVLNPALREIPPESLAAMGPEALTDLVKAGAMGGAKPIDYTRPDGSVVRAIVLPNGTHHFLPEAKTGGASTVVSTVTEPGGKFQVARDKATGEERWRKPAGMTDSQQAFLGALDNAERIASQYEELIPAVLPEAEGGDLASGARVQSNRWISMPTRRATGDTTIKVWDSLEGEIGTLARALGGEKGVLTQKDIERAKSMIPNDGDTQASARAKLARLREALVEKRKPFMSDAAPKAAAPTEAATEGSEIERFKAANPGVELEPIEDETPGPLSSLMSALGPAEAAAEEIPPGMSAAGIAGSPSRLDRLERMYADEIAKAPKGSFTKGSKAQLEVVDPEMVDIALAGADPQVRTRLKQLAEAIHAERTTERARREKADLDSLYAAARAERAKKAQ